MMSKGPWPRESSNIERGHRHTKKYICTALNFVFKENSLRRNSSKLVKLGLNRVCQLVGLLGWVDLDFGCSIFYLVLLGLKDMKLAELAYI